MTLRRLSAWLPITDDWLADQPAPCFVHTRPSPVCDDGRCAVAGRLAWLARFDAKLAASWDALDRGA